MSEAALGVDRGLAAAGEQHRVHGRVGEQEISFAVVKHPSITD